MKKRISFYTEEEKYSKFKTYLLINKKKVNETYDEWLNDFINKNKKTKISKARERDAKYEQIKIL